MGEAGARPAPHGRGEATLLPADPAAPEALRALAHRTALGTPVAVRAVGRQAAAWSARHLADCLEGAGFLGAAVAGAEATAVRDRSLADSVRPGLRILCVGLNPSLVSADAGVGYASATNRFWPAAVAAGLVRVPRDVDAALAAGVGITDLVKRATARAASLEPADYQAGVARVDRLVRWLRPDVVAFVGLTGYRAAVDGRATAGPQPTPFGGRPAYVLPSTSGANAHATLDVLVAHLEAAQRMATPSS